MYKFLLILLIFAASCSKKATVTSRKSEPIKKPDVKAPVDNQTGKIKEKAKPPVNEKVVSLEEREKLILSHTRMKELYGIYTGMKNEDFLSLYGSLSEIKKNIRKMNKTYGKMTKVKGSYISGKATLKPELPFEINIDFQDPVTGVADNTHIQRLSMYCEWKLTPDKVKGFLDTLHGSPVYGTEWEDKGNKQLHSKLYWRDKEGKMIQLFYTDKSKPGGVMSLALISPKYFDRMRKRGLKEIIPYKGQ